MGAPPRAGGSSRWPLRARWPRALSRALLPRWTVPAGRPAGRLHARLTRVALSSRPGRAGRRARRGPRWGVPLREHKCAMRARVRL